MKPIMIYGAGGFAREVLELIRDINRLRATWQPVGFLSDDATEYGTVINGLEVLGGVDVLERDPQGSAIVLGLGSPVAKYRVARRLIALGCETPTLVHPTVVKSDTVDLAVGVVVTASNVLTCNIRVDRFAMLNLGCTVGHDAVVGAYATLSPGVHVSGNVKLDDGVEVGTGTVLVPGIEVGAWSIVGAGAVVSKPVPPNCTAVGVPAKVIKTRNEGWHEHA